MYTREESRKHDRQREGSHGTGNSKGTGLRDTESLEWIFSEGDITEGTGRVDYTGGSVIVIALSWTVNDKESNKQTNEGRWKWSNLTFQVLLSPEWRGSYVKETFNLVWTLSVDSLCLSYLLTYLVFDQGTSRIGSNYIY